MGCGGIAFGFDGFAIAVALALVVNDITGVASIAFGLDFAGGPDPGAAEGKTGLGDMMSARAGLVVNVFVKQYAVMGKVG